MLGVMCMMLMSGLTIKLNVNIGLTDNVNLLQVLEHLTTKYARI